MSLLGYHLGGHYTERIGCSSGEIINRSYKIFRLDPHPKKKIIVIRGEITVQITNDAADELLGEETRDFKKIIRLEGLKENTNVEKIVEEIFEKCPFVDKRFEEYLISMTEVVKNRVYDEDGMAVTCEDEDDDDPSEDFSDCFEGDTGADLEEDNQGVNMTCLEYYIELLYEELSDKVKGAKFISRLTKMSENLVAIANHETALNALFRTLREDYKKSLDLTTCILQVCFYYSQFEDFHDMLITNKICSITFDILEYEMTRNEKWKEEVLHRKELAEGADASSKVKHNFEKMMGRYSEVTRKQDDLLRVAFDVIFRLYENPLVHEEILQRGIVGYLMEALERKNIDLLLLVVDFLKTLSIFSECKTVMNQLQIVDKIFLLVDSNFPNDLISLCLRLLYNLSFDTKMRHRMVKLGLLPKLGHFFGDPELEPVCLNIFYIMSMDRRIRPKIAPTNVVPITMRILAKVEEDCLNVEARSLAINLSHNKRCSISMCSNNGVANILAKAFENEDPLMMKIIRNLSQHDGPTKELFIEFISDLAGAITKVGGRDFALECVGTLGHLTISDLDYAKLLREFDLIPWIKTVLQNPKNNSLSASKKEGKISLLDILCTVVFFLGTCAGDGDCAEFLIQEEILDLLLKTFNNRGDRPIDIDIKNHILFFFYKLSGHEKTRAYLVENTRIPQMLLDLLHDSNREVRELSEAALDLIGGYNEAWESQVKKERFRIYNEPWIEMMEKISKDPLLQADMELASSLGYSPKPTNRGRELEAGIQKRDIKATMQMPTADVDGEADTSDGANSGSEDSDTEVDEDSQSDGSNENYSGKEKQAHSHHRSNQSRAGASGRGESGSKKNKNKGKVVQGEGQGLDQLSVGFGDGDDNERPLNSHSGDSNEEYEEDEEDRRGHHKSFFDQFKQQFDYEMDRKEMFEYGIDDFSGDDDEGGNEDEDFQFPLSHPDSLTYRVSSANVKNMSARRFAPKSATARLHSSTSNLPRAGMSGFGGAGSGAGRSNDPLSMVGVPLTSSSSSKPLIPSSVRSKSLERWKKLGRVTSASYRLRLRGNPSRQKMNSPDSMTIDERADDEGGEDWDESERT